MKLCGATWNTSTASACLNPVSKKQKNELLNVSLTDVLFAKFDIDKDFMVVNHVLLLGKYFIYRCKLDNIKPSLAVFKAKLKATLNLEFYIARKKGTLAQHYRKWNIFIPVLI